MNLSHAKSRTPLGFACLGGRSLDFFSAGPMFPCQDGRRWQAQVAAASGEGGGALLRQRQPWRHKAGHTEPWRVTEDGFRAGQTQLCGRAPARCPNHKAPPHPRHKGDGVHKGPTDWSRILVSFLFCPENTWYVQATSNGLGRSTPVIQGECIHSHSFV